MISKQLLFSLMPTLLIFGTGILPAMVIFFLFKRQTQHKRSPLNMDLLRSPGETLREKIDELNDEIMEKFLFMCLGPVLIYSILIGQQAVSGTPLGTSFLLIVLIAVVGTCIWQGKKLYAVFIQRNNLRLGYGCEVAAGQGLDPLAKQGFNIFHDFPATKNFNIDHIAVGPQGVFAVETKGRSKFTKTENDNWKVRFDGEKLVFPDRTETKPVEQARRQAGWLAQWIRNATCENIHVTPVLAIPGWYVELPKKPSDVKIGNGKNFSFLANNGRVLSEKQIQMISFQIEKACRTVQVKAYKK